MTNPNTVYSPPTECPYASEDEKLCPICQRGPALDTDYAVVVGISNYHASLRSLDGPVTDALRFCKWVHNLGKVPRDHIESIISEGPPKPCDRPVQQEIDTAFDHIFTKARLKKARRLYFYFAGHGCSAEINHVALIMANASMDSLNYSLNSSSYHEGLARRPLFKEQLFFYDCCRSFDRRVRGRDAPWTDVDPGPGAADVQQFILYGAAFTKYANEKTIEFTEKRGLFTQALLEGLEGGAAQDKQGQRVITAKSLIPFVSDRLAELAKSHGLQQKPSLGPGLVDDLVIVEGLRHGPLNNVTVKGPDDDLEIIVKDDRLKEVQRQPIVAGKAEFALSVGLYQFSVANDSKRACLAAVRANKQLIVNL